MQEYWKVTYRRNGWKEKYYYGTEQKVINHIDRYIKHEGEKGMNIKIINETDARFMQIALGITFKIVE